MGLHRDGATLGLSPFESEMRRRLWHHITQIDYRTADVLGVKPSLDLECEDETVKTPWNVDDEDLYPEMTEMPPERKGITSISLCLVRCRNLELLRRLQSPDKSEIRWESLANPNIPLALKDKLINEMEDDMESRVLRYCDPLIHLHTFVSLMCRSSICKMRMFAHRPYSDNPNKVSPVDRKIVFANAKKLLEYVTLTSQAGGKAILEKYSWQFGTSHLWNTVLYVLIELSHHSADPDVGRVWELIGQVFSGYPQVFEDSAGPVYTALGKWTLEVWDKYVAATKADGRPEPVPLEYITAIRLCRANKRVLATEQHPMPRSTNKILASAETGFLTPEESSTDHHASTGMQSQGGGEDYDFLDFDPLATYDFPDLGSFETDPNEWEQWKHLVAVQGDFVQAESMLTYPVM